MIVLALDIAKTATGWAAGDGSWKFGVLKCKLVPPVWLERNDIDAIYTGAVADWFRTELLKLVVAHRPDHAVIEKPLPGNITQSVLTHVPHGEFWGERVIKQKSGATAYATTHFLHGLAVEAVSLLHRRGIPTEYVPVQNWRKTLGIHRPPKSEANPRRWYKQEAIRQCKLRGIEVDQADAAEAICLGIHHLGTLGWNKKIRVGQLV